MKLCASARIVMAHMPGTVLDVVYRARLPEGTVRARVAELKRAGLLRIIARKTPPRRGGSWCVYAQA